MFYGSEVIKATSEAMDLTAVEAQKKILPQDLDIG